MCCKTPLFIGIFDILHLYFFEQKKVILLLKASLFNVWDLAFYSTLLFCFSIVDNMPQAAKISSPRDLRMVVVIPLLVR